MDFSLSFEQQALIDAIAAFVDGELIPHEEEVERLGHVPDEIAGPIKQKAIANGFYAMNMPEELGGGGLDHLSYALVYRELGRTSYALSTLLNNPANILLNCQGGQIETYLMPTIRGERMECFALSEPGAGSDARAIVTSARRDGDTWLINGTKQFISQADIADYIILFAVTGETGAGPEAEKRFTAFLIDMDTPGVTVTPLPCTSTRGYNPNMIYLENVRVGDDKVLGNEGEGFNFANDWLYSGRVMLSAACVGKARRVLDMTSKWAAERQAFGQAVGDFQGVGFQIADMAMEIELADAMVLRSAWQMDQGSLSRKDASICNLFASEMIGRVTDKAVQIFGGMGLIQELPIERFWRDARIERIWEGTSEIQRHIIARDTLRAYRE